MISPSFRIVLTLALVFLCSRTAMSGDGVLKGSLILHPDIQGFENRWFAGVGGEWPVSSSALLGFELQSAYRNQVVGGKLTTRFVPINIFVTAKWRPGGGAARPYLVGGIGLVSALTWTSYTSWGVEPIHIRAFEYERNIGYQFGGGVEIHQRWMIEFLVRRSIADAVIIQTYAGGPELNYSIAGGIRW